jgi:molecular chaperone GrpE (heat shock protein)
LENNGVDQFGEVGDVFDEKKHLSVENTDTLEQGQDGKVSEVLQKGYKMGEKVLREGKVKVFVKK